MNREIVVTDIDEFTDFIRENKREVSSRIIESIKEAIDEERKEAVVFEIVLQDVGEVLHFYYEEEIWIDLLEQLLEDLKEDTEYADPAIDAYQLLKKLK